MNFFKKLFSKRTSQSSTSNPSNPSKDHVNFKGIHAKEDAEKRFKEDTIDSGLVKGCAQMLEGYFKANKITDYIKDPLTHPSNLDKSINEGFGFALYCKSSDFGERETAFFMALAIADYLMKKYDFKLFKDNQPEYPLRVMALKYNKNDVVLSLYPFEYASKALNYGDGFEMLVERVEANLNQLTSVKQQLDAFLDDIDDE